MKFRQLSEWSLARLKELDVKPSFWNAIYKDSDPRIEIINNLGNSAEPALVPCLVRYALKPERVFQDMVRLAISKLIASVPLDRLIEFDAFARDSYGYWGYEEFAWGDFAVRDVSLLSQEKDSGLLAFATMHPNGRVREAAVRLFASCNNGSELAFILIRANDWVGPVRERACELILERLRPDYAESFLKCLPLIFQLQRCGRAKHRWLLDSVSDLLRQDQCFAVLQVGLRSEDKKVRRSCLQLLVAKDSSEVQSELVLALKDQDPMNRLLAVQCLLALKRPDLYARVWADMKEDPFMPLRREALYARVQIGGDALRSDLLAALFDRHPSVRSAARFFLGKEFDAASYYRSSLDSAAGLKLTSAIRGLGECGVNADADMLSCFLCSPEIRLRKAAIVSVAHLAAVRYEDQLLIALQDAAPGVSALACAVLQSIAISLDICRLELLLKESPFPHVRKNVLRISRCLNKWEQVIYVITASRDGSPDVSDLARSIALRWHARYNVSFVKPTEEQVSRVERALDASRTLLNSRHVLEFEGILRTWK